MRSRVFYYIAQHWWRYALVFAFPTMKKFLCENCCMTKDHYEIAVTNHIKNRTDRKLCTNTECHPMTLIRANHRTCPQYIKLVAPGANYVGRNSVADWSKIIFTVNFTQMWKCWVWPFMHKIFTLQRLLPPLTITPWVLWRQRTHWYFL